MSGEVSKDQDRIDEGRKTVVTDNLKASNLVCVLFNRDFMHTCGDV